LPRVVNRGDVFERGAGKKNHIYEKNEEKRA